jgi:multisubunit Na+/H+ antiporter MnhF subunit
LNLQTTWTIVRPTLPDLILAAAACAAIAVAVLFVVRALSNTGSDGAER